MVRVLPVTVTVSRIRANADYVAMKFSQITVENCRSLLREHERIKRHTESCNCALLVSSRSTFFAMNSEFWAFTLSPIGYSTCTRENKTRKPSLLDVLMALYNLHRHNPHPFIHGDPRLPNLIVNNDRKTLTWIDVKSSFDVLSSPEPIAYHVQCDMNILIFSLLPSYSPDLWTSNVTLAVLVRSYSVLPTVASIKELNMHILEVYGPEINKNSKEVDL